jgi:RimJ/RimL family protein N-acetyltransferase
MCIIDRPEIERPEIDPPGVAGMTVDITTPRLTLRPPQERDVAALARMASDYAIASMTTRMPHPYGEEDARQFVALTSRQDRARENTFIVEAGDEGVVGALGFHRTPEGGLEMGYWIGRPFWDRGFATEAARGALRWADEVWRRRVIVAGHFADNPASANVLIKAGFLYTGEVQRRHSRARGAIAPTRMMVWLA